MFDGAISGAISLATCGIGGLYGASVGAASQ